MKKNKFNYTFKSLDEAWSVISSEVLEKGERVGNTHELRNVKFVIEDIGKNILNVRENFSLHYYLGEMIWYGVGSNSTEFISKFGRVWEHLSDDGVTNNSAYGFILKHKHGFNQIDKMVELLRKDPSSRRAVININVPNINVIETKDEMCTIALQFFVRDGKLEMTTMMRSNDLWTGTPYDIFYFTEIQKMIAKKLKLNYGTYTHFVTSIHIYNRNIDDIYKSLQNYRTGNYKTHRINGQKLFEKCYHLYEDLLSVPNEEIKKEVVRLCKKEGIIK